MNKLAFWDRWVNRIRAETVVGLNDSELLTWLGIEPGDNSYRGKAALKEATVFACIRILADAVGKLPIKIYQESEGKQITGSHPLGELIKLRPNPWMSSRDFFRALEVQRNLYGNAFAWIDTAPSGRNAGKIQGLYPLDSNRVTIYVDDIGLIPGGKGIWYVYSGPDGKQYKLKPDEILHFKGLTTDGLVGMTPLEQLKGVVEYAGSANKFLNNSLKNGLQVKGIIQYIGDLNQQSRKTFREQFEEMSNGLNNANRVALLPIGYQYIPISLTMSDAQFLENTRLTIRQIAAAFGIKNHQLNDLDRATHTNITEQQREFYIDTLMDILTGYEQELTYKLLLTKELEQGYYIKFNVNAILRADPKTRYESYRIAIQSGFKTPNEVRELEEDAPRPGGDRLLINGNMMPIEMAGVQYTKGGDTSAE